MCMIGFLIVNFCFEFLIDMIAVGNFLAVLLFSFALELQSVHTLLFLHNCFLTVLFIFEFANSKSTGKESFSNLEERVCVEDLKISCYLTIMCWIKVEFTSLATICLISS